MKMENILNLIETIVIIIAAVIVGAWAIYRSWSLNELDKARTEIKILKDSLTKRGDLNISLKSSQISSHLDLKNY